MKRSPFVWALLIVFFLNFSSFAQERIYTIQVASLKTLERANQLFLELDKTLPEDEKDHLRIERIGKFFVIRVGKFSSSHEAQRHLKTIKKHIPGAFIRTAFYIKGRILKLYKKPIQPAIAEKTTKPAPKAQPTQKTTPKTQPQKPSPPKFEPKKQIKGGRVNYLPYLIGLVVLFGLVVFLYIKRFHYIYLIKKMSGPSHGFLMDFSSNPRRRAIQLREKLDELISLLRTNKTPLPFKTNPPEGYHVKNLWFIEKPDKKLLKGNNIVCITGEVVLPQSEILQSILFSDGRVVTGQGSTVRTIIANGPIKVSKDTKVLEFLDSESEVEFSEGTEVLEAATSSARMTLSKGVVFRCLYALPITTYNYKQNKQNNIPENLKDYVPPKGQKILRINKTIQSPSGSIDIPSANKVTHHIVAGESVSIGQGSLVKGNIKAGQRIIISQNSVVEGSISANSEVVINENSTILSESVSAKDKIVIHSGTRIGNKDMPCLIRCDGEVILHPDVEIYGTIITKNGFVV